MLIFVLKLSFCCALYELFYLAFSDHFVDVVARVEAWRLAICNVNVVFLSAVSKKEKDRFWILL